VELQYARYTFILYSVFHSKENYMSNSILKSVCMATLMLTCSLQIQAKVVDEIEKTFKVDSDSSFRLDNINGSLDIIGWNKDVIKVTAVITADNQRDRDRISIDMVQNSRGVNVETRYAKKSTSKNLHSGKVDYTIRVPFDAQLPSIELVNGSLTIENVMGEINAELVNGEIFATGLAGDSEISSENGSINVKYQKVASQLNNIILEAVNGSVKLYLPDEISASVNVETVHGIIKNDFGLKAEKGMFVGHFLTGSIGSGDVDISIDSVNGSVKVLKN